METIEAQVEEYQQMKHTGQLESQSSDYFSKYIVRMAEVHSMYTEATGLLYSYNKTKLIVWLGKTENLIIFENFINLMKDKLCDIYDNVSNFTSHASLKVSMNYFKSEFDKPKSRRNQKASRKTDETVESEDELTLTNPPAQS
jgi:hypothetical protein